MKSALQSPKNTFLIVLYNTNPSESPTLLSLIAHYTANPATNIKLVVWDNSQDSHYNQTSQIVCNALQFQYFHTPENTSLSVIYNKIANNLPINSFVTILDQDTELSSEYFSELNKLQNEGINLILPIVICKNKIVSPGKRIYSHGILIKELMPGYRSSKNLLAINSGMSISQKVFKKFSYDTRLRFYGTDTYFMRQYEKFFASAYIMESRINHSLAEMEEKDQAWRRSHLNERLRTFKIIFDTSITERIFVRIHSIFLKFKYRRNE